MASWCVNKTDALRARYPWWVWSLVALVMGYGTAQDNAHKLAGSTGWGLVVSWFLIGTGVFVFVLTGWIAFEKFRARHASR